MQHDWFLRINHFAVATPVLHTPLRLYAEYGVVLFGAALLLNQPLAKEFHEARPYAAFPHAMMLVARSHDYSFPSDHAVMAGAVAAGIFLVDRRLGAGATVTVLGLLAARRLLIPVVTALTRTPLRPLITASRTQPAQP